MGKNSQNWAIIVSVTLCCDLVLGRPLYTFSFNPYFLLGHRGLAYRFISGGLNYFVDAS